MTRAEAIAIIRKEMLCVARDCDIERSCGKCDLMMPSKEPIIQAYKIAINSLQIDEQYDLMYEQAEPTQNCVENALGALECISRQAVEEIINDIRDCISVEGYCAILERLKKLPYVNPQETVTEFADRCRECGAKYGRLLKQEPKTGHWIVWDTSSYDWTYKCDKCGSIVFKQSKYCPNCGCRMFEPQESEEE